MDEGAAQREQQGDGRFYVRFGSRPTEEIPREWAEKMLTSLKEHQPAQFGKLLSEAIGAVRK
jgi:hypothetical protein